jgi:hypothetical protein
MVEMASPLNLTCDSIHMRIVWKPERETSRSPDHLLINFDQKKVTRRHSIDRSSIIIPQVRFSVCRCRFIRLFVQQRKSTNILEIMDGSPATSSAESTSSVIERDIYGNVIHPEAIQATKISFITLNSLKGIGG